MNLVCNYDTKLLIGKENSNLNNVLKFKPKDRYLGNVG